MRCIGEVIIKVGQSETVYALIVVVDKNGYINYTIINNNTKAEYNLDVGKVGPFIKVPLPNLIYPYLDNTENADHTTILLGDAVNESIASIEKCDVVSCNFYEIP